MFFESLIDAMTPSFLKKPRHSYAEASKECIPDTTCIGQVRGHATAKQGLLIAATGRHNVLMIGPPGEGKTLLASTLPGFLSHLTSSEMEERARFLQSKNYPVRPFIKTNPTATPSQLLGSGHSRPTPGLITEAHGGILFLDEIAEFKKGTLESLRTPLEDGHIFVTRGGITECFPSRFQLVGAMNPCPCGYYDDSELPTEQPICKCNPREVIRYRRKLSGPILNRIDLILPIEEVPSKDQFSPPVPNQSSIFLAKVKEATSFRELMRGQFFPNSEIPGYETFNPHSTFFNWTPASLDVLKQVMDQPKFSTRQATRLAKVSRSVADLVQSEELLPIHVREAKSFIDHEIL